MTATRIMELLRELRTLDEMAHHIGKLTGLSCQPAWRLVLVAIDDRCALLTGVLSFEDAALLRECEIRVALEPGDGDATALAFPSSLDASNGIGSQPRVTIH